MEKIILSLYRKKYLLLWVIIVALAIVYIPKDKPTNNTTLDTKQGEVYRIACLSDYNNHSDTNKRDEYIYSCTQAITFFPDDYQLYHQRANIYGYDQRYYQQWLADSNQSIQLYTGSDKDILAELYITRARLKHHVWDYTGTINDYTLAILQDTDDGYLYSVRAQTYKEMKKYTEAINDYTTSNNIGLKNKEESPILYDNYFFQENYRNRAQIYTELGNYTWALNDYSKCIDIDLSYWCYYYRAEIYEKIDNYTGAIQDYTQEIVKNKDEVFAYEKRWLLKIKLWDKTGWCEDLSTYLKFLKNSEYEYIKNTYDDEVKKVVDLCK